ncbi:Uncharacterized protein TCM_015973 [Theobroma cacao]|uniref:Uncharacterized protein n=1 Tax=Theobroma cacao TaxID=3641 RepID=A0A061G440_THECC|nr:Uncharacterized protein TCM_015973 [Theobroma cacao]
MVCSLPMPMCIINVDLYEQLIALRNKAIWIIYINAQEDKFFYVVFFPKDKMAIGDAIFGIHQLELWTKVGHENLIPNYSKYHKRTLLQLFFLTTSWLMAGMAIHGE